jgi:hypothetical protein
MDGMDEADGTEPPHPGMQPGNPRADPNTTQEGAHPGGRRPEHHTKGRLSNNFWLVCAKCATGCSSTRANRYQPKSLEEHGLTSNPWHSRERNTG